MCSLTFAHRDSKVLADEVQSGSSAGMLNEDVHLPGEFLTSLISFIGQILPSWRDEPIRPRGTTETVLTAQLCSRLTSATRHSGWDFIQFRREEPNSNDVRRAIDLVVAPSGIIIWIEGRSYNEYQILLPIECKRLPTPSGTNRDQREYLHSRFSTTGGIQRFKAGHHASDHIRAAMIGYVQDGDISSWAKRVDCWIDELESEAVDGWTAADKLTVVEQNLSARTASLSSEHSRSGGLAAIRLDHLWIEM